ncbi:hypothetical protein EDD41_1397 [Luteococcus japonicus]|uniref:Uncharacterized protein n=1 Tax=Luteococcus japonicus TaxID=33984 RepID=A0A3N1ZTM3_9ACTN|nr:hypothetical protein [Luteococcus japonicus]ROR54204.1 hypothetical protein EDD41_1397 [Luteococcus japonicus]
MDIDPSLGPLLAQLGTLTATNTSAAVATRIQASKAAGKHEETVNELQDIIEQLIDERSQLQQIATALRDHLVAESIGRGDITYITDKLLPTVEELMGLGGGDEEQSEALAVVKKLVSKEMLTILQLVGFNYKRAIGEPLTRVVENLITSSLPSEDQIKLQSLMVERDVQALKVAQNVKAMGNYQKLTAES